MYDGGWRRVVSKRLLKVEASGNDFILGLGEWAEVLKVDESYGARLCDRRRGIGADGCLAVFARSANEIDVVYRNADGGIASFCANGMRCAARAAHDYLGIGPELSLNTAWTRIRAKVDDSSVEIEVPAPPQGVEKLSLDTRGASWRCVLIEIGVPHLITRARGALSEIDVGRLGWELRSNEALGPDGSNVNFVEVDPDHRLLIRTYERGIEGETLSCGSGVLAASHWYMCETGRDRVECVTRSGDVLEVSRLHRGSHCYLLLRGPAEVVAEIEPIGNLAAIAG